MLCEMCGKSLELYDVYRVRVEGTVLKVCRACSSCGVILSSPEILKKRSKKEKHVVKPEATPTQKSSYSSKTDSDELELDIVSDFGKRVHHARERKGMTQHDAAIKLNEKESVLKKIEVGELPPDFKLAKKLERFFGITLIEEVSLESSPSTTQTSQETLTLGDLVKIKKRTPK